MKSLNCQTTQIIEKILVSYNNLSDPLKIKTIKVRIELLQISYPFYLIDEELSDPVLSCRTGLSSAGEAASGPVSVLFDVGGDLTKLAVDVEW